MNIKTCKNCKRLFKYVNSPFCQECVKEMDDLFRDVRDYIYENSDARVEDIVENTNASEEMVLEFLREGRLSLSTESTLLTCTRCGKPVKTGTLCDSCKKTQLNELESARNSLAHSLGRDIKQPVRTTFTSNANPKGRMHTNIGEKK